MAARSFARRVTQKFFQGAACLAGIWLLATPVGSGSAGKATTLVATKLRLRFSLWQNHLPVDALPLEGWMELQILSEDELTALAF